MKTLIEPGHEHQAYELTGSEALTYDDVARILTEVLGRDIRYERPSALRFWREMRRHGHPTAYVNVMTALYTVSRLGLAAHLTDTTEALLQRPPIAFRQFAIDHAHAWKPIPVDGDNLHLAETAVGGIHPTAYDPDFERKRRQVEDIASRYRDTLRALSE